ncbi:MAG TPA: nitrilase-related carbon-nitrogen hydrolase [Fimbriimonas sp.]|nr:nitrilase-related carbon-nitrogen hydrolase [Fimbriimonas sp.]
MAFQLACAQFAPNKAEVESNLDRIAEIALQAQQENVDLLLLPEACTSGYFLEGGVLESSLTANQLLEKLSNRLRRKIQRPIDIALGFYQNDEGNLYNSAAYIELLPEGPRLVGVYRKFFLPTYGVFDEERFVTRGRDLCVMETRFGRMALLICEDVWHGVMPTLCAVNGAQVILVPAASPGRGFSGDEIDNRDRYRRLFRAISEEHGVYCANAQLCGFEGGKGFIGGSMVIDPTGHVAAEAPMGDEALLVTEIDLELVSIARAQSPLIGDLQSVWEEVRRLFAMTTF